MSQAWLESQYQLVQGLETLFRSSLALFYIAINYFTFWLYFSAECLRPSQGPGMQLSGKVHGKHAQGPQFNFQHWKKTR